MPVPTLAFSTTPSTRFPQTSSFLGNFVGICGGKTAKNPELFDSVIDIVFVFVFVFVFVVVVVVAVVVGIRCNANYAFALRDGRGVDFGIITLGIQPILIRQGNLVMFLCPAGVGGVFSLDYFFVVL